MAIRYRLHWFWNKTYYGIISKTWLVDLNKRPSSLQINRRFAWINFSFFRRNQLFKVNNLVILKLNFIEKHFNCKNDWKTLFYFKTNKILVWNSNNPLVIWSQPYFSARRPKKHTPVRSTGEHAPVNLSQHTLENFRALFYTLDRFSVGWIKILVRLQHTLTPNKNSGV